MIRIRFYFLRKVSKTYFSKLILKVLLYFYIVEIGLKLTGNGIIRFFSDLWNLFDSFLLILYAIHFLFPQEFRIDISPFRLLKIMLFLALFIKPLQIMLLSLSKSLKFLMEALIIVLIFTFYFALSGLHVFFGLFRYRCYDA